jgi:hypothetical protein
VYGFNKADFISAVLSFIYLGKCVQQIFPPDGNTTITTNTTTNTTNTTTKTDRATSRKVAGSIPDGDIGIFHLRNFSGRTKTEGD